MREQMDDMFEPVQPWLPLEAHLEGTPGGPRSN
jgi:hypothetical protein